MRKLFPRIAILLVFILGMFTVAASGSSALSKNMNSTPKLFLEDYLDAVKHQDLEKMMNNIVDERHLTVDDYLEIMSRDKLNSYEIVTAKKIDEEHHYFVVRGSYDSGLVCETPVEVKKLNTEWKVVVNSNTLTSDDNKIIKQGNDQYVNKHLNRKKMKTADVITWWNYSRKFGGITFYSDSTFSVPHQKHLILAIDRQGATGFAKSIGITYAVVQKGFLGDKVWGKKYVRGSIVMGKRFRINGKSKTFKGAHLRFTPNLKGGIYHTIGAVDW
ncbi:hypothetical protein PJ311_11810 [Bacillus sp. CLL-7-23]|uniref:Uncharacterized protein n=1 Tax=Bacillus changyiensis TaxID=3004103 RepID=A0ABT4X4W8_9BACI|nr:hypothetical protein [Bacillus changyiensis]MDA7027294.1 hypothetical protein [Bacillus changyiensis]